MRIVREQELLQVVHGAPIQFVHLKDMHIDYRHPSWRVFEIAVLSSQAFFDAFRFRTRNLFIPTKRPLLCTILASCRLVISILIISVGLLLRGLGSDSSILRIDLLTNP